MTLSRFMWDGVATRPFALSESLLHCCSSLSTNEYFQAPATLMVFFASTNSMGV